MAPASVGVNLHLWIGLVRYWIIVEFNRSNGKTVTISVVERAIDISAGLGTLLENCLAPTEPITSLPGRYKTAILLQLLAPLSWSFGLWVVYPALSVTGNACLSCFLQIGASITASATAIALAPTGTFFFLTGMLLFVSSLGLLASNKNAQAENGCAGWDHGSQNGETNLQSRTFPMSFARFYSGLSLLAYSWLSYLFRES